MTRETYLEAKRAAWRADTHKRSERCKPCSMLPEHCDIHGKRFAPMA